MISTRRPCILLVEDNPGDARLAQEALTDCDVDHVVRADEASDRLARDAYDAVLLDLTLPDSSGLGTFRRLHQDHPDVPIVVLSGYDDEDVATAALQAGAQDYLVKGRSDPDLFARSVVYAIERHRIVDELTNLNRMKDEFVAIASHELRSPLTSIIGFSEMLSVKWDRFDDGERLEFVGLIEKQATRLLRMANDLLVMSRIELDVLEPEAEDVDLASALDEVADEFTGQDAQIEVCVPNGIRAHVDRDHLRQMLTNYVTNALRYGKEPVRVEVTAGDQVVISVCDRGDGVPEAFIPHLFDKFTRADPGAEEGTGLGLSIVRGLARSAGGDAWYERTEEDSRFCVSLPCA